MDDCIPNTSCPSDGRLGPAAGPADAGRRRRVRRGFGAAMGQLWARAPEEHFAGGVTASDEVERGVEAIERSDGGEGRIFQSLDAPARPGVVHVDTSRLTHRPHCSAAAPALKIRSVQNRPGGAAAINSRRTSSKPLTN